MKNRLIHTVAACAWLVLALSACGGDSPTAPAAPPEPSFPQVQGTYTGSMSGTAPWLTEPGGTVALAADFALTIGQNGGDLSGSWTLAGVAEGCVPGVGCVTDTVSGGGSMSGRVSESGAMVLTFADPVCGPITWTGNVTAQVFTVSGPFTLTSGCVAIARYVASITFVR